MKKADRRPGPYPYYGASGVVDHVDQYIFEGEYLLIAEDGENLRNRKLPVAFIATGKFWVNNHAHIVWSNALSNTRFLAYLLDRIDISGYLSGSTMPKLTQGNMNRIEVRLPTKPVQDAIVTFVSSLDRKLYLNLRMNRTLKKMAAAIFKSWFIEFDPVHAKAEGRAPNRPDEIADLFPDAFEDSDLGPIPNGWTVKALIEAITINPKRTLAKGTLAPFLEMSNMPTRGPSPDAWRMREMTSGTKFINGDTLVARITPCLENGKTAFVDFLYDEQVGWGSTEYIVLRPYGKIPPVFVYLLAPTPSFRTFAIRQMAGSSGRQRVPPESLSKYRLVIPERDSRIFRAFDDVIQPLFERIKLSMKQNRRLTGLRDTLLPKLLSGEIALPALRDNIEERDNGCRWT